MECFKVCNLQLGDKKFEVSLPISGSETPFLNLFNALEILKSSDETEFNKFLEALKFNDTKVEKPDNRRNRDLPFLIKKNLKKFNIDMEVLSESKWQEFCDQYSKTKEIKINSDAKSFFLDGTIYVRQDQFSVSDSTHELAHLILAAMRGNNFSEYANFIHTFFEHPEVKKIAYQLKVAGTYSDNYLLDFEEEACVRYLEGIFTEEALFVPEFEIDGEKIDTIQFLNNSLKDIITKTFGLKTFPGVITFFNQLIRDVPEYGSTMFDNYYHDSTGYKDAKQKIIEAENINALINYYISEEGGKLIEKGECI